MLRECLVKGIAYQGSLRTGEDLLRGLTHVIEENNIVCGRITGIGAVTQARVAYFDHEHKRYEELLIKEGMEILSLTGNISKKDGELFPHVHVVLSGRDFRAFGGHLLHDTLVYAFEYEIIPFDGKPLIRQFDKDTGLFLWKE
ncbi:MAG TPA: PPC domain-containing DNA-binding protein [Dissulfurispiraceae bacterium]|nr:PPC domain-containing DNA-binding protein [Dissulfurispiraceae bacterium]